MNTRASTSRATQQPSTACKEHVAPRQLGQHILSTKRWPEHARMDMAVCVVDAMNLEDRTHVRETGEFPAGTEAAGRLAAGYRKAIAFVHSHIEHDDAAAAAATDNAAAGNAHGGDGRDDPQPAHGIALAAQAAAIDADDASSVAASGDGSSSDSDSDDVASAGGDEHSQDAQQAVNVGEQQAEQARAEQEPPPKRQRVPKGGRSMTNPQGYGAVSESGRKPAPTDQQIKLQAKKWAKRLLIVGDVRDHPPHEKGYKTERMREPLKGIRDLLLTGYEVECDDTTFTHIFNDLEDLQRRDKAARDANPDLPGPSFAELFEATGLKTLRSLWGHLKIVYPKLRRVKQRVKRVRKDKAKVQVCAAHVCLPGCILSDVCHVLALATCGPCGQSRRAVTVLTSILRVQRCANEILGKEPVTFPEYYADPVCKEACQQYGIFDPGYDYRWSHANGQNQWFIDAYTLDASKMLSDEVGIWEAGIPQPVQEVSVAHASPGAAPKVQVFIATHVKLGTLAFYPYHSSRGGRQNSFTDFKWWVTELTEEDVKAIVKFSHYVPDGALAKAKAEVRASVTSEFDVDNFLVCHSFLTPLRFPAAAAAGPAHALANCRRHCSALGSRACAH